MKEIDWVSDQTFSHSNQPKTFLWSLVAAFLIESVLVTAIGWHEHWLAHPQKTTGLDDTQFIEAQVYKVPTEAHLVEEKKPTAAVQKTEQTLSKTPGKGAPSPQSTPLEEENKTTSGPKLPPDHGPVAVYAPSPTIPSYLQDKEIKTNVVIDFYVNTQGVASARLAGSSGNEELDAIALKTVQKWVFRAAEKGGKPIDSKVRLRIVFLVQ